MNLSVKTRSLNPAWSCGQPAPPAPRPAPLRGDRQARGHRGPTGQGARRLPGIRPGCQRHRYAGTPASAAPATGKRSLFCSPPAGQRLEKRGKGNETQKLRGRKHLVLKVIRSISFIADQRSWHCVKQYVLNNMFCSSTKY